MTSRVDNLFFGGFFCVDALRPSQQFFSHVGMISCLTGFNRLISRG